MKQPWRYVWKACSVWEERGKRGEDPTCGPVRTRVVSRRKHGRARKS